MKDNKDIIIISGPTWSLVKSSLLENRFYLGGSALFILFLSLLGGWFLNGFIMVLVGSALITASMYYSFNTAFRIDLMEETITWLSSPKKMVLYFSEIEKIMLEYRIKETVVLSGRNIDEQIVLTDTWLLSAMDRKGFVHHMITFYDYYQALETTGKIRSATGITLDRDNSLKPGQKPVTEQNLSDGDL